MNTKLHLFCAVFLCLAIEWNAALAADLAAGVPKAVETNFENGAYETATTLSTESGNEIQQADLVIVKILLDCNGLGYPKSNAQSRIALKKIYDDPQNHSKEELENARQAYLDDTDVEKPKNGERYTIKFYGYDQKAFLLDYTGGKVSTHVVTSGEQPGESACFKAQVLPNGKIAFQTADKKYLSYPTKSPAPTWLTGFSVNGVTDNLDESVNGLELQKAGKGTKVKSENFLNLFGKFFIKSKRGNRTDTNQEVQGFWMLDIVKNSFDGTDVPFFNEQLSSVILIEPVKVANGIQHIDELAKRTGENRIYTLFGQRIFVKKLSDLPRGIYIVNGKKVLVK
ncbi:hypothetical protein HMPREF1870_00545 [Bacteroidales bacterium KA00344]|nr:hypothetical protein HMPREF1870_00545 [Bacteroidales bacterium KA00344]